MSRSIILACVLALSTGCNSVRHTFGLDRHDAKEISVPVAQRIEIQLAADGNAVFFEQIDGAPSIIRMFVKNSAWNVPGAWHEIPVMAAADSARATEYAVVSIASQSAHVYNQPSFPSRTLVVESVPPNAYDPGMPFEQAGVQP